MSRENLIDSAPKFGRCFFLIWTKQTAAAISDLSLTARELEILQYIVEGMSNKEIAAALYISEKTVKNHITSLLRKLDVEDRTQAAVFAVSQGLFPQE